jgi:predicted ester cyclase
LEAGTEHAQAPQREDDMTRAELETLLLDHRDCFARRDVAGLTASHAPDGTLEGPATGLVKGRPAIEAVYKYWFTAFPDLLLTWDEAVFGEERAVFFWTLTGTASGPFYGLPGSGTAVKAVGAADYRFGEGGIVSARHVVDFTGVLVAAGVLKARPA